MNKYLKTAGYVLLYLAIMIAAFIPCKYFMYNYFPSRSTDFNSFISKYPLLMIFTVFVISIIAYYFIFKLRKKDMFKVCSFSKVSAKNSILLTFLGLFMLTLTLGISSFDSFLIKYPELEIYINGTMKTNGSIVALVILSCIIVLAEEIIFRGVIFGEMKANIHVVPAALIHALIYALIIGEPVVGTVSFLACLIYAFVYTVVGSLWATLTVQLSNALGLMFLVNIGFKDYLNYCDGAIKYFITIAGAIGIGAMLYLIKTTNKNLGSKIKMNGVVQ